MQYTSLFDRFLALLAVPKYSMALAMEFEGSEADDDNDNKSKNINDDDVGDNDSVVAVVDDDDDDDDDVTVKVSHLISPRQKMVSTSFGSICVRVLARAYSKPFAMVCDGFLPMFLSVSPNTCYSDSVCVLNQFACVSRIYQPFK
jgi:hypothetical protein